jgi:hypothetical protein
MSLDFALLKHYPGCPQCGRGSETVYYFDRNITHNLAAMAQEAGVYDCLWRHSENGIWKAKQLIDPLLAGITKMHQHPELFVKHNPENGWGNYRGLCDWLTDLLEACWKNPGADISSHR